MVNRSNKLFAFLDEPASNVAPRILGSVIERTIDGQLLRARIVEVEAYDQTDAASHSYKGRTPRTEIMFGPSGHLYVYFTYGMHYCCNIVTGPPGYGAAVLLRAAEPLTGQTEMERRRDGQEGLNVTNGPAKLCKALGIDKALNGHDLRKAPLQLIPGSLLPGERIIKSTRIGITHAIDLPWRFYIADNRFVSKPH